MNAAPSQSVDRFFLWRSRYSYDICGEIGVNPRGYVIRGDYTATYLLFRDERDFLLRTREDSNYRKVQHLGFNEYDVFLVPALNQNDWNELYVDLLLKANMLLEVNNPIDILLEAI